MVHIKKDMGCFSVRIMATTAIVRPEHECWWGEGQILVFVSVFFFVIVFVFARACQLTESECWVGDGHIFVFVFAFFFVLVFVFVFVFVSQSMSADGEWVSGRRGSHS